MATRILHIGYSDAKHLFPANTANDFIIELPNELVAYNCSTCCVRQILYKASVPLQLAHATVISDVCEQQYCYGEQRPVLANVVLKDAEYWENIVMYTPIHVPLRRGISKYIHFEILCDQKNAVLNDFKIVLEFRHL